MSPATAIWVFASDFHVRLLMSILWGCSSDPLCSLVRQSRVFIQAFYCISVATLDGIDESLCFYEVHISVFKRYLCGTSQSHQMHQVATVQYLKWHCLRMWVRERQCITHHSALQCNMWSYSTSKCISVHHSVIGTVYDFADQESSCNKNIMLLTDSKLQGGCGYQASDATLRSRGDLPSTLSNANQLLNDLFIVMWMTSS